MAYLLILTGPRATELVELNPSATLILGSGANTHIQLPEADVAEVHCQVYPAEGLYWIQDLGHGHTLLNLAPLSNQISALYPFDVVVVGRAYLQFHVERPATIERPQAEAAEARAVETVDRLRGELAQATATIEHLSEETGTRERDLKDAVERAEKLRTQVEQLETERVELAEMAQDRAQQLEAVRLELEQAAASGDDRVVTLTRDLAEARERLLSSAAALAALGAEAAREDLPRSSPDEIGALLDEAGLPPEVAAALEAKLVTMVDREVVRRFAGAAPRFERAARPEIDEEMRALRARTSALAAALEESVPGA